MSVLEADDLLLMILAKTIPRIKKVLRSPVISFSDFSLIESSPESYKEAI